MSGYTVEVRTGILTGANDLHTWLYITKPDGSREAWGFHPAPDGNILYGPGDVQAESVTKQYTSTSGPLTLTQDQYNTLVGNIAAQDAAPPDYSVLSLPGGVQCSMWAVDMLQRPGVDLIPSTISPEVTPELIPILDALIWNPLVQSAGFEAYELLKRISEYFTTAQRFIQRRDPLTLDLNGNGIETVPVNAANPILFDHEGNGIKTGTGWIAPSDGFLVLDRDGNGTIDNGTELFGDNTPLYGVNGTGAGTAADGFAALAQQDTNADGIVNSSDANFADLRVWQDLNQDGISQDGELSTLDQLGIASINVGKTENSRILPNGNQIADLGTFVRNDGTSGSAGTTSGLADVNLASDTFHRSFVDTIPLTTQTATLPDMQGSGAVRDLREAASIQTLEGATLATALGQFATSTTRNEQRAQLDTLLTDWAATSGFEDMAAQAAAHGYTLTTNLSPAWQHKLHVLETFNGRTFYKMPWDTINAQSGVTGMSVTHDATGDRPTPCGCSLALDANGNRSIDRLYWKAANDEVFEVRRMG